MKPLQMAFLVLAFVAPACGKTPMPVRPVADAGPLSSGPRFDEPTGDGSPPPAPSPGAARRAEECLANPTCPAADAARLFMAASDANDPAVDCFRFLDGMGTGRDPVRARACFERGAKALECAGNSADLATAELAIMRIDGVGGASNVDAARALLAGCFDDVTRSAILEHAAAKERDPRAPSVDFCGDIGGTTITGNECVARAGKNADTKRAIEAKAVVAALDDTGRELFAASEKAYGDYAAAMGAFVYEVYVQGTIRGAMSLGEEQKQKAGRAKELADFRGFVAKGISAKEIEGAQRALGAALAKVSTATPAEREALQKTQKTWMAYRDADIALYEHVFGPKQGVDRVHATVLVVLESRRAKDCVLPSAGPR
jgi:Lysozyme inhibitor LprI